MDESEGGQAPGGVPGFGEVVGPRAGSVKMRCPTAGSVKKKQTMGYGEGAGLPRTLHGHPGTTKQKPGQAQLEGRQAHPFLLHLFKQYIQRERKRESLYSVADTILGAGKSTEIRETGSLLLKRKMRDSQPCKVIGRNTPGRAQAKTLSGKGQRVSEEQKAASVARARDRRGSQKGQAEPGWPQKGCDPKC